MESRCPLSKISTAGRDPRCPGPTGQTRPGWGVELTGANNITVHIYNAADALEGMFSDYGYNNICTNFADSMLHFPERLLIYVTLSRLYVGIGTNNDVFCINLSRLEYGKFVQIYPESKLQSRRKGLRSRGGCWSQERARIGAKQQRAARASTSARRLSRAVTKRLTTGAGLAPKWALRNLEII